MINSQLSVIANTSAAIFLQVARCNREIAAPSACNESDTHSARNDGSEISSHGRGFCSHRHVFLTIIILCKYWLYSNNAQSP